jgi:hypothetical protein
MPCILPLIASAKPTCTKTFRSLSAVDKRIGDYAQIENDFRQMVFLSINDDKRRVRIGVSLFTQTFEVKE